MLHTSLHGLNHAFSSCDTFTCDKIIEYLLITINPKRITQVNLQWVINTSKVIKVFVLCLDLSSKHKQDEASLYSSVFHSKQVDDVMIC